MIVKRLLTAFLFLAATASAGTGAVTLKGRSVTVPVTAGTVDALPEGVQLERGRSLLFIENVRLESGQHPGVKYRIHLSRRSEPAKRVPVATISWYGLLDPQPGNAPARTGHALLYYDVTSELARLGRPPLSDIAVTFEPTRDNPRAGRVTVGAIRIRIAR